MFEPNGGWGGGASKQPQDPYLRSISQFMQNTQFLSFLADALSKCIKRKKCFFLYTLYK